KDVTRERETQEKVFQELRHAIDFLDQAPAGFFSCGKNGAISYMNATLAGWLDYDLRDNGTASLKLTELVAGHGAELIASVAGGAGEVRAEQFDIDLKCRNGQSFPARVIHQVLCGQDGTAGTSRTLV